MHAVGAQGMHVANLDELQAAMTHARAAKHTQVIVIDTTHTRTTADGGCWWEVAIPEVSERAQVNEAHQRYQAGRQDQRS